MRRRTQNQNQVQVVLLNVHQRKVNLLKKLPALPFCASQDRGQTDRETWNAGVKSTYNKLGGSACVENCEVPFWPCGPIVLPPGCPPKCAPAQSQFAKEAASLPFCAAAREGADRASWNAGVKSTYNKLGGSACVENCEVPFWPCGPELTETETETLSAGKCSTPSDTAHNCHYKQKSFWNPGKGLIQDLNNICLTEGAPKNLQDICIVDASASVCNTQTGEGAPCHWYGSAPTRSHYCIGMTGKNPGGINDQCVGQTIDDCTGMDCQWI